ncbi:MAG: hypothetical protein KAT04_08670 [Methylococcales bacterium]|nr:hypothetical protein [Methylococcales bacterium]
MAEISFVANLAYFELKTYKLRDQLKAESDRIEKLYISDDQESSSEISDNGKLLLEPEWGRLKNFDKVEEGAWDTKCIHWLYKYFIFTGADRKIVGLIMISVALLLIAFTASIGMSVDALKHHSLWWLCFWILSLSCLVPALLIWLVQSCKKYAFGGKSKKGRVYSLGQAFMKKLMAYSMDRMGIN